MWEHVPADPRVHVKFDTGHTNNVFAARYMPTSDTAIVTCAGDHQVCTCQLRTVFFFGSFFWVFSLSLSLSLSLKRYAVGDVAAYFVP